MKKITWFSVLALCVTLGWNVHLGWAEPEHGWAKEHGDGHCHGYAMMAHHGCMGDHLHHLLQHQKDLGLTEEQVAKLQAIHLDLDRARIRGEADIRVAERELTALLEDEKTELSAIEAKVKQSEMLEVAVRMAAFKARRDALAVLTPDQRQKAKAAHERRMHEMMSGRSSDHSGRGHQPAGGQKTE